MADSESLQNLYAKNLRQSYGYPLRFPEPKPGLPSSYAENGLHIGDVGYVDAEGVFEVLFNICFPPDHELHQDQLDIGRLVGLTEFKPNKASRLPNALPSGRIIYHGIQSSLDDDQKHIQRFKSHSTSGAILALPSGAVRQYLNDGQEKEFRKLAEGYARDWCQFADRNSLYLITGFYKSNSWRLASFHNIRPAGRVILERDYAGGYKWHPGCDHRDSGENQNENQAVFISGFKIEVRDRDNRVLVERLSTRSGSIWSEWGSFLVASLVSFWQWIAEGMLPKLRVHIKDVPALSQPFHPSDIINRYLLDKNPNAPVAITHDSQWLNMLEKNELFHEDMMDEGRFRAFLEENCMDDATPGNVVYLRRKANPPNNGGNNLRRSTPFPMIFYVPTVPYETQPFITRMRAENIIMHPRRMPVGFYVLVQFNGTKRRSKCKPVALCDNIIEWDDEIMLPMDLTVKIQFSIIASFEFEPILGNGKMLCTLEMSMGNLAQDKRTCLLSSMWREDAPFCPSLLITLEERPFNSFLNLGLSNSNLVCEEAPCSLAEVTDKGHEALLQYHRGGGLEKLIESVGCFKLALALCFPNHNHRAAALFNHATASFISAQVHGTISDLDVVIQSYRNSLALRPDSHPDRPGTLLHLAQALSVRYAKVQCEASVADEIERLVAEVKMARSETSYECRAANLLVQTLRQYRAWESGKLVEFDEWVSEVDRSARLPPDWHFDRPYRLANFSIALRKYFEITGHLDYLGRSISVMEEALQLVSDGYFDKPWMLALLGDALCARFVQCGDVTELASSISVIEEAMKLTPNGHFDKPRMLASLGEAVRLRSIQFGDVSDLNNSIAMIEDAVKLTPDGHFDKPRMLTFLGDAFCTHFVQCGDITELASSISMFEDAVKHTPDSHFDKSWMLASLGDALCVHFVQLGDVADLENSITMIEDAVEFAPDGYFVKPWMLASLGSALHVRFVQRSNIADLDNSIAMIEDAVKLTPGGYFDKPWMLASLGHALRLRFLQRGDVVDLDNSISMIEDAMELIPDGHFGKPRMLASWGDALCLRFAQRGDVADLNNSIAMITNAIELAPDSHFDMPRMLASRGNALRVRFVQHGNIADLNNSIAMIEDAVKLAPGGHFDKPWMLASLGDGLRLRFLRHGDITDLDKSISMITDAMELVPDGHFDKPRMLTSRGDALRLRFVQRGDVADLNNSIAMITGAAELTTDGHFDKHWVLASLGGALRVRFVQHGDIADLDNSIATIEDAVKFAPARYFDKSWMLASLGDGLRLRFLRHGDIADLDNSISMITDAVELVPDSHFDKPRMLASRGDALRLRFVQLGDVADLNNAITMLEDAVKLTPDGHFDMPWVVASLGSALRLRFVQRGDLADLNNSIAMIENAVELAPGGHFDKPWMLASLSNALHARFVQFGNVADLDDSITIIEDAVKSVPDRHFDKPWMLASLESKIEIHLQSLAAKTDSKPLCVGVSQTLKPILLASNEPRPIRHRSNVVLFGEIGSGKSSLVNLVLDREVARTSSGAWGCTLDARPYDITIQEQGFRIFDTVGLSDPQSLRDPDWLIGAISKAYRLVRFLSETGGINLLVFCIRMGRITANMQQNYTLFHDFLCHKNVPVVLVITHLEHEENMEDWWLYNQPYFTKSGIHTVGHACITTKRKFGDRYHASRQAVHDLLMTHGCGAGFTQEKVSWLTGVSQKLLGSTGFSPRLDSFGVRARKLREYGLTEDEIATLLVKISATDEDMAAVRPLRQHVSTRLLRPVRRTAGF